MVVLMNPRARGGSGEKRWQRVQEELRRRFGDLRMIPFENPADARSRVAAALRDGEREFIAAGGDGTVSFLADSLLELAGRDTHGEIRMGAIGLGSSNDFHKPASRGERIGGVPCRIAFPQAAPHDAGLLQFEDADGGVCARHWVLNASIGLTAEGNLAFNRAGGFLSRLKLWSPALGIAYAAVRTGISFQPRTWSIAQDGGPAARERLANLGVVKNPHVSGSLRYDSPYEPGSGSFDIQICRATSRAGMFLTLARLLRGRFLGLPWTRTASGTRLEVAADSPFAVEIDGEVVQTRRACFSLQPRALRICP